MGGNRPGGRLALHRLCRISARHRLHFVDAATLGAERNWFFRGKRSANLWLVLPDDEGVFHGSQEQNGVRYVSAVQTYLDLKGQPEHGRTPP